MAKVSAGLGKPLFPWQRYVADVASEVLPDGSWAYDSVTIFVQRRAGKTVLVEPVTMHRCSQAERRSVWLTAQKRENAVKRWRDIRDTFETSQFKPLVRSTIGTSHEAVRWARSGSAFTPFAPDEESMHGEDPDLVWVDELWAFSMEDRQKIRAGYTPAWSVKSGQEWKMSAAGTLRSGWLKHERQAGRAAVEAGVRQGQAFFEWCVPEQVGGVDVYDLGDDQLLQLVMANHPRSGHGLRRDYLAGELQDATSRKEFIRAYGGLDSDESGGSDTVIPWADYRRAGSEASIPEDATRLGFGFAVDQLQREGSISVSWPRPDGVRLVELVECRPGVRWMTGRLAELTDRYPDAVFAVNNIGAARRVADELQAGGRELLRLPEADWQAACSRLSDAWTDVDEGSQPGVLHADEPALAAAVEAASTRQLKSGRAWTSRDGQPITALESHTLAVWAVDHLPATTGPFKWTAY